MFGTFFCATRYFQRHKYFPFGWSYCYFRLSIVFEIAVFEIAMIIHPGSQLERNKFDVFLIKHLGTFCIYPKRNRCADQADGVGDSIEPIEPPSPPSTGL